LAESFLDIRFLSQIRRRADVSLAQLVAVRPHLFAGIHLARVRQVGEGLGPTLDAVMFVTQNDTFVKENAKRSLRQEVFAGGCGSLRRRRVRPHHQKLVLGNLN